MPTPSARKQTRIGGMGRAGVAKKRVATIFFQELEDEKQKRIMLKFAKLQIIG
jgi:hypothetical protein